jgi:hypothetical protein
MAIADKNTLKQLGTDPYASLLAHIRSVESYNYNSIAGSKRGNPEPFGDLTKKTIGEILNDKTIKSPSPSISEQNTALGAYQILKRYLLNDYATLAGLNQNDLFSKENQDLMAIAKIERAIGSFRLQQNNDIIKASESLCKIWAGLRCLAPIPKGRDKTYPNIDIKRGMSYYADVSINANDVKLDLANKFQSILNGINSNSTESPGTQGISPTPPSPKPQTPPTPIPEGEYLQLIQD